MPTSFHGQMSKILDFILLENPKSILDIGIGFGKYGVLCRDQLDIPFERYKKEEWKTKIDGIEGYEGYNNPIHQYVYNKVFYGLIEDVIKKLEEPYDLGLMIDVLEHFEKSEGKVVLQRLLQICKSVIVAVPAIPCEQHYLDNDLEKHKSAWKAEEFKIYNVKKIEVIPMGGYNSSIIILLEGLK